MVELTQRHRAVTGVCLLQPTGAGTFVQLGQRGFFHVISLLYAATFTRAPRWPAGAPAGLGAPALTAKQGYPFP